MQRMDFALATSEAIEGALSRRLEDIRLGRNITQSDLARKAGVSRSTITRLAQGGKGVSLDSFIRVMQALQLQGHLETLLPDPGVSPLKRLQQEKETRQRARPKKSKSQGWAWSDGDTET